MLFQMNPSSNDATTMMPTQKQHHENLVPQPRPLRQRQHPHPAIYSYNDRNRFEEVKIRKDFLQHVQRIIQQSTARHAEYIDLKRMYFALESARVIFLEDWKFFSPMCKRPDTLVNMANMARKLAKQMFDIIFEEHGEVGARIVLDERLARIREAQMQMKPLKKAQSLPNMFIYSNCNGRVATWTQVNQIEEEDDDDEDEEEILNLPMAPPVPIQAEPNTNLVTSAATVNWNRAQQWQQQSTHEPHGGGQYGQSNMHTSKYANSVKTRPLACSIALRRCMSSINLSNDLQEHYKRSQYL